MERRSVHVVRLAGESDCHVFNPVVLSNGRGGLGFTIRWEFDTQQHSPDTPTKERKRVSARSKLAW